MRSDPNGYDWRALGYSSLEAFIESKAGACPEWPQEKPPPFAADDEDDPAPRGDAEQEQACWDGLKRDDDRRRMDEADA